MLKKLASLSVIGISVFVLIVGNASAIADMEEVVANFPYYQNINQTYSEHYNLVANSDLLISEASPNENKPLGFSVSAGFVNADLSLSNGVFTMKATRQYPQFFNTNSIPTSIGDKVYYFSRLKSFTSSSTDVSFFVVNPSQQNYLVVNTNDFQFISNISTRQNTSFTIYIVDNRASGWTLIEVDYIGAINITDLVSRGILPSGLTDAEYKIILDDKVQDASPYFNFNLEYDFTELGDSVIPGIVSFLDQIGSAADWIHNLFDFLIPSTGTNNFASEFGESRLIYLFNNMSPSHRWIQWFRLDDAQYESIFNLLTVPEKTFLGSLNLDDYEKVAYSQTYIALHLPSEEFILGLNQYAVSSRFTTYERCVAWALAQS